MDIPTAPRLRDWLHSLANEQAGSGMPLRAWLAALRLAIKRVRLERPTYGRIAWVLADAFDPEETADEDEPDPEMERLLVETGGADPRGAGAAMRATGAAIAGLGQAEWDADDDPGLFLGRMADALLDRDLTVFDAEPSWELLEIMLRATASPPDVAPDPETDDGESDGDGDSDDAIRDDSADSAN